jgi:biopolymer transport protein ExbD
VGRKRGRRRDTKIQLRMTSMMDILTVLLLFLLKSFVVDGEVITPVPGVDLPESTSEAPPASALVVAVFDDTIMLDGKVVGNVAAANSSPELYIGSLGEVLRRSRDQELDLARRRGEEEGPGKVAIQGDRDISFEILERVMYTCNQSGYADISLAVLGAS